MTTEARMNEPRPIRGRWTIRSQFVGDDGYLHEARVEGGPTPGYGFVEVVPVPDEQAIERAAIALFALAGWPPRMAHYAREAWPNVSESLRARHRAQARAVLAAALEQPE
jgi:hypothetical protein